MYWTYVENSANLIGIQLGNTLISWKYENSHAINGKEKRICNNKKTVAIMVGFTGECGWKFKHKILSKLAEWKEEKQAKNQNNYTSIYVLRAPGNCMHRHCSLIYNAQWCGEWERKLNFIANNITQKMNASNFPMMN